MDLLRCRLTPATTLACVFRSRLGLDFCFVFSRVLARYAESSREAFKFPSKVPRLGKKKELGRKDEASSSFDQFTGVLMR